MAFALATVDRGGCHQRAFPILYELGGEWKGEPVNQTGLKHKAEIVIYQQNYLAALGTFVKCDFAQYGIMEDTYRQMLAGAAGIELSLEELLNIGDRVWNMTRLFNIREGFERKHDSIPQRFLKEPVPGGAQKGQIISEDDLNSLLNDYYQLRGWDSNGRPENEKLNLSF